MTRSRILWKCLKAGHFNSIACQHFHIHQTNVKAENLFTFHLAAWVLNRAFVHKSFATSQPKKIFPSVTAFVVWANCELRILKKQIYGFLSSCVTLKWRNKEREIVTKFSFREGQKCSVSIEQKWKWHEKREHFLYWRVLHLFAISWRRETLSSRCDVKTRKIRADVYMW